jgi:hypothetical protein
MKAYVTTTGALFSVLALVHLWRAIADSASTPKGPFFIFIAVACAALAVWAWRVRRNLSNV